MLRVEKARAPYGWNAECCGKHYCGRPKDRTGRSGRVRSGQVRCCLREAHDDMETMDGVPCGYASSVVVAPSIQVHGGHTLAERKKQRPLCGRKPQSGIRAGQCSAVQCLRCGVEHRSCLSVEPALWLSLCLRTLLRVDARSLARPAGHSARGLAARPRDKGRSVRSALPAGGPGATQ